MNFNTILYRFGLKQNDFDNRLIDPKWKRRRFYLWVMQADNDKNYPYCDNKNNYKHNYFYKESSCCINLHLKKVLRIRKIKYKCCKCEKAFTNKIKGIDTKDTITKQVKDIICNKFFKVKNYKE